MGLLDFFRNEVDTGIEFELEHISVFDLASFIRVKDKPNFTGAYREIELGAIEYAGLANLFSGRFRVFMNKIDQGYKPILKPIQIHSSNANVITARIIFPKEINDEADGATSSWAPSLEDWKLYGRVQPVLVCSIPTSTSQSTLARIYFESVKGSPLSEVICKTNGNVRHCYIGRLHDVSVGFTDQRYAFEKWKL